MLVVLLFREFISRYFYFREEMQRDFLIYTNCIEIPKSTSVAITGPLSETDRRQLRHRTASVANIRKVSAVSAPRVMVMRVAHF